MIPIFIGYDPRETVGLHVAMQSVLENTDARCAFTPLTGLQGDATNRFSHERWGIPARCGFRGWAVWMESDMVLRPGADIEEVLNFAHFSRDIAVYVVKHDYHTKFPVKYFGQVNSNYPCKNWSSFMLINNAHPAWQALPSSPAARHRFTFLAASQIGALPRAWNHLVGEYDPDPASRLLHFTIGIPPLWTYEEKNKWEVQEWYDARTRTLRAHE
jgi:hypothetical protein